MNRRQTAAWRDEETLRELYENREMSMIEIGDLLGCTQQCVWQWMQRFGIESRSLSEASATGPEHQVWVPYARFETIRGREVWRDRASGRVVVQVSRLAAVAWFGWEAVIENVVHHEDEIPWHNAEYNFVLLSDSDHKRHHALKQSEAKRGMFAEEYR